jgi:hypothetical protein
MDIMGWIKGQIKKFSMAALFMGSMLLAEAMVHGFRGKYCWNRFVIFVRHYCEPGTKKGMRQ